MQALTHSTFGEPAAVISLTDVPKPEPGPGEVRLRMLRSPIHNHDLATIRGVYGYKPKLPATGGTEMIGVVDACGEGVSAPAVGTRVAYLSRWGWAEYALATASQCVPLPDSISDDMGAQLLAMPVSAVVLLDELHVQPGAWIAQNAAGGAVGKLLMALAQEAGVNIVNLVRRASAADELRAHGAKHVVVTEEEGWQAKVRALTDGAGFTRIVDSVAGPGTVDLQRLLAQFGEIVIFGGLSGAAIKLDPSLMISLECSVRGFWITTWMQRASAEQRVSAVQRVFGLAMKGALPLPVAAVYPLSKAAEALAAAEKPGRPGKVLFST
jgi:NADPH:quinone reductase-like Zn-dependent oxidoreductase